MRLSLSSHPLLYILFDPIFLSLKKNPWLFLYWATKDLYYKAWKTMKIPLLWDRGTTQKGKRNKRKKNMWRSKRGLNLSSPIKRSRLKEPEQKKKKKKEKARGYNQAYLLAKELSNHLKIPIYDDIIYREKSTTIMRSLGAAQRENNIKMYQYQ